MKRASSTMASRTMRGSGLVLSPNQAAMPRVGGLTEQKRCVAQSTAGPWFQGRLCQGPNV